MTKTNFMLQHMWGVPIIQPRDVVRIDTTLPDDPPSYAMLFIDEEIRYHLAYDAIVETDFYQMSRSAIRANDFLPWKESRERQTGGIRRNRAREIAQVNGARH